MGTRAHKYNLIGDWKQRMFGKILLHILSHVKMIFLKYHKWDISNSKSTETNMVGRPAESDVQSRSFFLAVLEKLSVFAILKLVSTFMYYIST